MRMVSTTILLPWVLAACGTPAPPPAAPPEQSALAVVRVQGQHASINGIYYDIVTPYPVFFTDMQETVQTRLTVCALLEGEFIKNQSTSSYQHTDAIATCAEQPPHPHIAAAAEPGERTIEFLLVPNGPR